MSLASATNRVDATGNGAVSTYPYTFRIFLNTDLQVTVRNTLDVETTLALTTDYTVTGVGAVNGGNVVLVSSGQAWLTGGFLTSGYIISIRRIRPLTQSTDIRNQGSFYPETHEDSFDHFVMIDQQQQDLLDRAVLLPETITASDFDPTLPTDVTTASVSIVTNASGNGFIVGPTVDQISSAQTYSLNSAASAAASAVSAGLSSASASASAISAAAALASENAAALAQTNAETAETNAELAETNAELAETNAELAETNAAASALAASGSAAAALASEQAAAIAKTNAETAETNAELAETNAETAETNAAASAAAALASENAAAATLLASVPGGAGVADIAALKAVAALSRADKDLRFVESTNQIYSFEAGSAAAGDDDFVVVPTAGTGRWLKVAPAYVKDSTFGIVDDGDITKVVKLQASGLTTATTRTITIPDANTTMVGTDTTQTLTNKTVDILTLDGQASAPANPSAGFYKAYVDDTTGNLTILNSSGTATTVGSGGGAFNYITSSNASGLSASDFTGYADLAGSTPVDMIGGSPTVTLATSASSPLTGTANLLFTHDAANRQGEGFSATYTTNVSDRGKVISFSMDYAIASGTYASGDLIFYAYDVTNSVLVQPMPYSILNHTLTSDKFFAEFQVPYDCASLRIGFHVATSTATAYTMKMDNLMLSDSSFGKWYGSATTDWIAYTPTFSAGLGTVTSVSAWYRRVGDSIQVMANWSNGTVAASLASMTLPTGLNVDTTKLKTVGSTSALIGQWVHDTNANETGSVLTYATGGNANQVYFGTSTIGTAKLTPQNGSTIMSSSNPLSLMLEVPISGWGNSQLLSDSADTRVIAARASGATTSIPNNAITLFINGTKTYDTHNAYSTSTGRFTVPVAGKYKVLTYSKLAAASFSANQVQEIYLFKNAAQYSVLARRVMQATVNNYFALSGSDDIDCIAGDILDVRILQQQGGAVAMDAETWVAFERIAGPAQIRASEKPTSIVRLDGGSGYGSTNTVIRRFTNIRTNQGSDITITQSASAGDSLTINTAGCYAFVYEEAPTVDARVGLSINSTELTTNIASIAIANKLAHWNTGGANNNGAAIAIIYCVPGDVIRVHTNAAGTQTSEAYMRFTATRIF